MSNLTITIVCKCGLSTISPNSFNLDTLSICAHCKKTYLTTVGKTNRTVREISKRDYNKMKKGR